MTVYVLIVSTKFGDDIDVYATEELALAALEQWVREEWDESKRGPIPVNGFVDEFFTDSYSDSYDILPKEVHDATAC